MGVVTLVRAYQKPQEMYNLEVARANSFSVGSSGWIVHNASDASELRKSMIDDGVVPEWVQRLTGLPGEDLNMSSKWRPHHLTPVATWDHPFVKRAADAGWEGNASKNGMALPFEKDQNFGLPEHRGRHPQYSTWYREQLDELEELAKIPDANGNTLPNKTAREQLEELQRKAVGEILKTPCPNGHLP